MEHLVVVCEEKKSGVGSFRSVGESGQQRSGGSVYRWWVGSNFIGGGTFPSCGDASSTSHPLQYRPTFNLATAAPKLRRPFSPSSTTWLTLPGS